MNTHYHDGILHCYQYPYSIFEYEHTTIGVSTRMIIIDDKVYYYFNRLDCDYKQIIDWYIGVYNDYDYCCNNNEVKTCDKVYNNEQCYTHDTIIKYVKYLKLCRISIINKLTTSRQPSINNKPTDELLTDDEYDEE